MTMTNRFMSCRDISKHLHEDFHIECRKSRVAILRRKCGLGYHWAKKREKLASSHILYRKKWATEIQKTDAWGLPWVISDESSFVFCPTRRKLYRFRGECSPDVFQDFAGYPVKIMVWGAIGPNFKSRLMRFTGSVNSASYIAMLRESGVLEYWFIHHGFLYIFQQDGARPHTASTSIDYISTRAQMLPKETHWPASSPDMSPIEQVWAWIKQNIVLANVTGPDTLFQEVERLWNQIDMKMINNLMKSLRPRIWTLEDLQGKHLAGHEDMIHVYEKQGLNGRLEARKLACIHELSENWQARVQHEMNKLRETAATIQELEEEQQNRDAFVNAMNVLEAELPGQWQWSRRL
jgi:hypothetical protein